MKALFLAATIFLTTCVATLSGCAVGEGHPLEEDSGPEIFPGTNEVDHLPILRRMEVTFHHTHTEEHVINCITSDAPQTWLIKSLHTESPKIEGSNPAYVCDPLDAYANILQLNCARHVTYGFPWYFQYVDFWLQRGWEGKYSGYVHIFVDGLEYFWCDVQFQVDDVNLIYL